MIGLELLPERKREKIADSLNQLVKIRGSQNLQIKSILPSEMKLLGKSRKKDRAILTALQCRVYRRPVYLRHGASN
jgi:hypothetical protein